MRMLTYVSLRERPEHQVLIVLPRIFLFVLSRFCRTDVFERSFTAKHLTVLGLFRVGLPTRRTEKLDERAYEKGV